MVDETSFPYLLWLIPTATAIAFLAFRPWSWFKTAVVAALVASVLYISLEAFKQGFGPLIIVGFVDIFVVYLLVCAITSLVGSAVRSWIKNRGLR